MKKLISLLLVIVIMFSVVACKPASVTLETQNDIITMKKTKEGATQLTILVKYAFTINEFEKAVEEKFPEIDIVQVANYTSDMGIDEYYARLKNGDLTDIVMTWPLEVGKEFWEDRLMDLSALTATTKYKVNALEEISENGKIHYLPGPTQVRSIVYNKTLFKENNWQVPTSFEEFISLCNKIDQDTNGEIRPLQLGLGNGEVLETALVGFNLNSTFSGAKGAKALADYNEGKGSYKDYFQPALETFKTLIDKNVLRKEDLDVIYAERELMLFNRKCAMTEDSVLLTRGGLGMTGTTDEFALMPFFNPVDADAGTGVKSDWARIYPVCYVGLNKDLNLPKNKSKYDLAIKLIDYISTHEGQNALSADTGAMFSRLKDTIPPDLPEIEKLVPTLNGGRYSIFPTLKNAQEALRRGLAGMVRGDTSIEQVIEMVDGQNQNPPMANLPSIIGQATEDFTFIETGNFLTDAMAKAGGCELALILDKGKDGLDNGKGICAKIYEGEITSNDIKRVVSGFKREEKGELWKITMTGENLIKTLEYSITVDNNRRGWFYYFSGLKMEFEPTAEMGSRIKSITDSKGDPIDPKRLYSIAIADYSVPNEYIESLEKTGLFVKDIFTQEIIDKKEISPSKDNRFIIK